MFKKLTPIVQSIVLRQARLAAATNVTALRNSSMNPAGSVWEPDYLDSLKPEFPQYESLNVQLKGYDYPVLESYQRYLHSVAEYLDIEVSDCYALPAQQTTVQRLRPSSTVIDAEYKLTTYERTLQMHDIDAPVYPVFLRIAQAALPEGVTLNVEEHNDEYEERRYVPDKDLLDLKAELERMGGSRSKK